MRKNKQPTNIIVENYLLTSQLVISPTPLLPQNIVKENDVVGQLHATLSIISLWQLIQISSIYYGKLQDVLSKMNIPPPMRHNLMKYLLKYMQATNVDIIFSHDEFSPSKFQANIILLSL